MKNGRRKSKIIALVIGSVISIIVWQPWNKPAGEANYINSVRIGEQVHNGTITIQEANQQLLDKPVIMGISPRPMTRSFFGSITHSFINSITTFIPKSISLIRSINSSSRANEFNLMAIALQKDAETLMNPGFSINNIGYLLGQLLGYFLIAVLLSLLFKWILRWIPAFRRQ